MPAPTVPSYCSLCGVQYDAPAHLRAYRNLCKDCWSSDTLREWDRIESARAQLEPGSPDTLTLAEWMHTIAAYHGKCCLCMQVPFARLSLLTMARGLVAENALPCCKACDYHLRRDFARAVERVTSQMGQDEP